MLGDDADARVVKVGVLGLLQGVERAAGTTRRSDEYADEALAAATRAAHPAHMWSSTAGIAGACVFATDPPASADALDILDRHGGDLCDADPGIAAWLLVEHAVARIGLELPVPLADVTDAVRVAESGGIAHAFAIAVDTAALAAARAGLLTPAMRLLGYVDGHLADLRGASPGNRWITARLAEATTAVPEAEGLHQRTPRRGDEPRAADGPPARDRGRRPCE